MCCLSFPTQHSVCFPSVCVPLPSPGARLPALPAENSQQITGQHPSVLSLQPRAAWKSRPTPNSSANLRLRLGPWCSEGSWHFLPEASGLTSPSWGNMWARGTPAGSFLVLLPATVLPPHHHLRGSPPLHLSASLPDLRQAAPLPSQVWHAFPRPRALRRAPHVHSVSHFRAVMRPCESYYHPLSADGEMESQRLAWVAELVRVGVGI